MYNYTPCTDPINVGEEIMELRAKMSNIEQIMDKIITKLSATTQPNPPQQSQPDLPPRTPSLSTTDDSIFVPPPLLSTPPTLQVLPYLDLHTSHRIHFTFVTAAG